MRVISGFLKGHPLKTIRRQSLRPTGSLVREAIFDILTHWDIDYHYVLDLYAGVGTFGIESLSRGAVSCVFVEKHFATAECLKKNLIQLKLIEKSTIFQKNVFKVLPHLAKIYVGLFNVIFIDPPYQKFPYHLLSFIIKYNLISLDSIFIVEHHYKVCISPPKQLRCFMVKQYDQTSVSFFHWNKKK